jgi:hypothetical protein
MARSVNKKWQHKKAHKLGACEFRGSPPGRDAAKPGANAAGSPRLQRNV